jgi:hypothetical protein
MRKLKLDVDLLQVESFDAAASEGVSTVRAHESADSFEGDTQCGTCAQDSCGGGVCTGWGCTDQTCQTCHQSCGWGCTREATCEFNCTYMAPCEW